MTVTVNVTDWGQEGQMQINSDQLLATACWSGFDTDNGWVAEWKNFKCDSSEELDKIIDKLLKMGFHLIG